MQTLQISQKKNVKECSILFKERSVLFSIYTYIYICLYISIYIYIYIYIYLYIFIEKRMERFAFFCKRTKHSRVLLHSLQKEVAFFAFFYVLCKRMLHSLRSFGSHKSPKTQKKNGKERCVL